MNGHTTRNTAVALSLLLIALSGCKNQFFDAFFPKAAPADGSATMVTLRIGATDSLSVKSASRSIMPSTGAIDGYDLYGAKTGGTQTLLKTFASLTGATISLEAGTWDFTLKARKDAATVILLGSKSSVVLSESTVSVDFTLATLSSGKGSVEVTVNWTSPSTVASVVASIGGIDEAAPLTITGSGPYSIKFNTDLDPGTYLVSFRFLDSNSKKVLVYSEGATIVPLLLSSITTSLSETDFNTVPSKPTGVTVTTAPNIINASSVTGLTVAWTDESDNETGFNIYLSSNTTTPAASVLAGVTTWTNSSASTTRGGTTSSYYVTAVNGFGSSSRQSSPVSGTAPFLISYGLGYTPAGSAPAAAEVAPSGNATLPTPPSRDGYDFSGWYYGAAQLTSGTSVTASKTYAAKWTLVTYLITYTLNGGANPSYNPTNYDVTAGKGLSPPTTTILGYEGSWCSDSTLTSTVDVIPKGSTGNKALYAKWTAIPYTITYELDGGTSPSSPSNPTTYTVSTSNITLLDLTKDKSAFEGWYGFDDFSGTRVTSIVKGTSGDKILYAKFAWTGPDQIAENLSTSKGAYTDSTVTDQLVRITKEEYALIASDSYLIPRGTGLAAFDENTSAALIGSTSNKYTFTTDWDTAPFTSSFPDYGWGNGYVIAFKYVPGTKYGANYSPSIRGVYGNNDTKTVTSLSTSCIVGSVNGDSGNGIMYFAIKKPSTAIPYRAKLAVSTNSFSVAYGPEGSVKIYYRNTTDSLIDSDWNLSSSAPNFSNTGYPLYQVLTTKSVKW